MRALLKEIFQNPLAMLYAILVHVVLGAVLFVSLEWTDAPTPAQPRVDIVKAVVVDESRILAELEKLKKAEAQKKKQENAKQRKLDKKAKEAERKRKREEKRLAKLRKEREAEKKHQKKLQKKRKAEEKRLAAERTKKKKELNRLQAEQAALEQQRAAEEQKLAEVAAQLKKEEQQRKSAETLRRKRELEAAMRAEIAAEQAHRNTENEKRLNSLRGRYIADIQNKVERNWIRPPSAKQGLSCKVAVKQIPGGEVINVTVTQCQGDEVFRRSVETAVYKASPLPRPSDPGLFDREIVFTFRPRK
ncbi:MAG: cell envelope integrity protein TolA [Gammaproteobacteria bacterium]|nr:cell envelope integrity protein TolA [Gammaproteobacteria bacterium]